MEMKETFTALLVEDSLSLGALYTEYLRGEGALVTQVNYGEDALRELAQWQPDILVLDIKLPDMSGMDILTQAQAQHPDTVVIMITAHGSIDIAVDAMRAGAFDFLVKPFDAKRLSITLRNARKQRQLVSLVSKYENSLPKSNYMGFIGESLAMQTVYKTIDCVANSKASVFIVGESGTGKEVCAQAVHHAGTRRDGPFIALNCASIPKDLIESEIFGHTKGAFTGAHASREGAASRAHGGTLFLDELCEMDLELQSKLLRFIQTGVFHRVGSAKEEQVDVRFVSATNRDPWEEVKAGRFREDLFYRLHVIPIELPPLRARGKDILLLANKLLAEYSAEEGKVFTELSDEVRQLLLSYPWPGNVRQLQNVIRQVVVLNEGPSVTKEMLPMQIVSAAAAPAEASQGRVSGAASTIGQEAIAHETLPQETLAASEGADKALVTGNDEIVPLWIAEKQTIEAAIARCDGNVPKAAALLDISASTIYRKRQSWEEMERESLNA
ncbi:sigma-54-dependent transcriptional regulator [Shewanella sp. KCT]|uniref:sigma-54-dependent transcriptional regulator n=1 Tax=Shewanella sp. KCT TaxID=2569535 RepID=UPI001182905F|nr:sigma-54 dependent transcriptional regulator [Shewanella sp. KCT]TVP10622.1 sigma-54-dependent Fis family transcriptional regulator [Shewanella sp. KCT]